MTTAAMLSRSVREIFSELKAAGIQLRIRGDRLEVKPSGLPTAIRDRIRDNRPAIIEALSATPETSESRWPEYANALKSGALVACVYCQHYSGPPSGALGACTALNVEACPVTPFQCRRYQRRVAAPKSIHQ